MCTCDKTLVSTFTPCGLMCVHKSLLVIYYSLISLSLNFHRDPSFCCGEIFLNNTDFLKTLILKVLCIFSQLGKPRDPKADISKVHRSFIGMKLSHFPYKTELKKVLRCSGSKSW